MTGPEHYREAEQLLLASAADVYDEGKSRISRADLLAEAQVHATLALAAAVAEAGPNYARPADGDEVDPPFWGSAWGRAIEGDPVDRSSAAERRGEAS